MQTSFMTPKFETSSKRKICLVKFWNTPLHYTFCPLKRRKTSNSLQQTLRSHFTLLYHEPMGHVWPVNTFISINIGVNLWLLEKWMNSIFIGCKCISWKCSQLQLIRGAFDNFIDSAGRHFSLFSQPSSLPTPPPLVFQRLLGWQLRSMYLWVALLFALQANTKYSALKSNP